MPMTDLGGFGQCKRQEMCHEGRALLDLLDWSKNFDLGIRNQLFLDALASLDLKLSVSG